MDCVWRRVVWMCEGEAKRNVGCVCLRGSRPDVWSIGAVERRTTGGAAYRKKQARALR